MEVWKRVEGFSEYAVSNYGFVKSLRRNRLLKPDTGGTGGYPRVTFSVNNQRARFTIHRLVALAFLTKIVGKELINHRDGVKTNNHVDNLEWCDCSENTVHAFDTGLRATGENSTNAEITNNVVHQVCRLIQSGWTRGKVLGLKLHPKLNKSKFDDIRRRRCWKRVSSQYEW